MVNPINQAAALLQPALGTPTSRNDPFMLPTRALTEMPSTPTTMVRVFRGLDDVSPVVGFTVYCDDATAAARTTQEVIRSTAGCLERYYHTAQEQFDAIATTTTGSADLRINRFSETVRTKATLCDLREHAASNGVVRLRLSAKPQSMLSAFFISTSLMQLCATTHPCMADVMGTIGATPLPSDFLRGDERRTQIADALFRSLESGQFRRLGDRFSCDGYGSAPVDRVLREFGIYGVDIDRQLPYFSTRGGACSYRYGVTVMFADPNPLRQVEYITAVNGHGSYSDEVMLSAAEFIQWYHTQAELRK